MMRRVTRCGRFIVLDYFSDPLPEQAFKEFERRALGDLRLTRAGT